MLGSLTPKQCKYILESNAIGRIGCYADGKMMIVPITYVSDGKSIYCHSMEGTKISMMRKNPNVCFQVDCIESLTNWRSVMATGKFQEIKTPSQQQKAKTLFIERLSPLRLGESADPARDFGNPPHIIQKKQRPVLFKIEIKSLTGRYEKTLLR